MKRSLGCLMLVMTIGCRPAPSAKPLAAATPITAEPQREGDPARGYSALVSGDYISLGIPWSAFEATMSTLDARDALPGRTGDGARVGYSFNVMTDRYGMKLATPNCLACHATHLNGALVLGLGRPHHTPARPSGTSTDFVAIDFALRTADELKAFSQFGAHLVGSQAAGALMSFATLAAHRDPDTLEWRDTLAFAPETDLRGWVDVPPWWRVKKKHGLYYNGSGRGDHVRHMMNMSVVSVRDLEEARAIDAQFQDIAAFIRTLEPPKFPGALDAEMVARGSGVFSENCQRCHGTPDDYPNLLVPAGEVGTDPLLAQHFWANQPAVEWFNRSFFGQGARYEPYVAYVAPPLDGIWATAPFFHNGSVPTLAAVLDSSVRPARWQMDFNDAEYDLTQVGWVGDSGEFYDTAEAGQSNAGHAFADDLSDDDRRALLEYLKTL